MTPPRSRDQAVKGDTQVGFDGRDVTAGGGTYRAGSVHRVTVAPGSNGTSAPTWFLLDAGVGRFSEGSTPLVTQCHGSRASWSTVDTAVDVLWTAPLNSTAPVVLRVAAATSMGNISVVAAVLTRFDDGRAGVGGELASADELGYGCTTSQASNRKDRSGRIEPEWALPQQSCESLPIGTKGALTKAACAKQCLRSATPPGCALAWGL